MKEKKWETYLNLGWLRMAFLKEGFWGWDPRVGRVSLIGKKNSGEREQAAWRSPGGRPVWETDGSPEWLIGVSRSHVTLQGLRRSVHLKSWAMRCRGDELRFKRFILAVGESMWGNQGRRGVGQKNEAMQGGGWGIQVLSWWENRQDLLIHWMWEPQRGRYKKWLLPLWFMPWPPSEFHSRWPFSYDCATCLAPSQK